MNASSTDTHSSDTAERLELLEKRIRELTDQVTEGSRRVRELRGELAAMRVKVDGTGPHFVALYSDFIEHFRGSTEEVTARLREYLPDVHRIVGSSGGADGGRVLDLGSGRGEWLELLREVGVPATGVDANDDFVESSRARGLNVVHDDAVEHLERLPANSVDMVSAFHLIEHVDVDQVLRLLMAAHRVLRPGGCVLLETPNPTNLRTAACDFYNDPSHRSPLPPALSEYLVSAAGFGQIEVRPLHPVTPPVESGGTRGRARSEAELAAALYGPTDYAVLGYKTHAAVASDSDG